MRKRKKNSHQDDMVYEVYRSNMEGFNENIDDIDRLRQEINESNAEKSKIRRPSIRIERGYKNVIEKKKIKERIIFVATMIILFILYLYIHEAITSIHGTVVYAKESNLLLLFIKTLKNSPVLTVVFIFCDFFVSRLLADKIVDPKPLIHVDERDGFLIDLTGEKGASHRALDEDKCEQYELRPISNPSGSIVGIDIKDPKTLLTLPLSESAYRSALYELIVAGTGAGKTKAYVIPQIYNCIKEGLSLVVTDPKGEDYSASIAQLKYYNYHTIQTLKLDGENFITSDTWDCMEPIKKARDPKTAAQRFVNSFLRAIADRTNKDFWNDANIACLKSAVLYVAKGKGFIPAQDRNRTAEEFDNFGATDIKQAVENNLRFAEAIEELMEECGDNYDEYRNIGEVYSLITSDRMIATISSSMKIFPEDRELLESDFNSWSKHSQRDSIQAGLGIALHLLSSKEVQRIMSTPGIRFEDYTHGKAALFIICNSADPTYYPIMTLFIDQFMQAVVQIANNNKVGNDIDTHLDEHLRIILEEAANIGHIPTLPNIVNTGRSLWIDMTLIYQNISQIKDYFSEINRSGRETWRSMLDACDLQICLGTNDYETQKYFCERCGYMTVFANRKTQKKNRFLGGFMNKFANPENSIMESKEKREVYTPDEIAHMKKDEQLLTIRGGYPSIERKYFFSNHPMNQIKMLDTVTGEIVKMLPAYHIPTDQHPERFDERYRPINLIEDDNKAEYGQKDNKSSLRFSDLFKQD